MLIVGARDNLHTAEQHRQPVGARCRCGHRSLISLERLEATGSMKPLYELKLKCSQCEGRDVELLLFFNAEQVQAFWEYLSYADVWDLRLYGQNLNEFPAKLYVGKPNPYRTEPAAP